VWRSLRFLEITAVVLAALAGLYGLTTAHALGARLGLVLLAPALEAALPLFARVWAPSRLHGARVIAALLVVFYIAFAPAGIDNRLYLPTAALLVVVLFLSNRERMRALTSSRDDRG
jgi:hypothetical protein